MEMQCIYVLLGHSLGARAAGQDHVQAMFAESAAQSMVNIKLANEELARSFPQNLLVALFPTCCPNMQVNGIVST